MGGGGGGECHDFPTKIFCLTVPKNFAGEPFSAVLQKFPVAKKFMDNGGGGGVSRFSVENFLSHSAGNFRRGILFCCIDFGYRKSLNKRGGGGVVSRFSVEIFLSHSAEKHCKGTLHCFTNFGHQKMLKVNRKDIWHDRDSNPEPTS